MRLRHIEVFHAVYISGSVTQAAVMLDVSQPSVSKVLAHAELQLGFKLFQRVKGRLVATPEARILHHEIADLYRGLGTVRRVADNLRETVEGRIRVAATPALGAELMPALVAGYMRTQPEVFFDLSTLHLEEIARGLLESKIDLGLGFDPAPMPGILTTPMGKGKFVLIVPEDHAIANQASVSINDIVGMSYIQLDNRGPLGQLLELHFTKAGLDLTSVASAETYQIARALVENGVGVAIVDEFTARSNPGNKAAVVELLPKLEFSIALMQREGVPLSRVCESFVESLLKSFDETGRISGE